MSSLLIVSSALITLALVFYTLGVWAERLRRYLLPWHVAAFWFGLAFDTAGTYGMSLMSRTWNPTDIHAVTGVNAIALMFTHAIWATWVVQRGGEEARGGFQRFSVVVWLVWLVPYFGGMYVGMSHIR
jgi:uncharacterized repeat protein (TIGR03987 family)